MKPNLEEAIRLRAETFHAQENGTSNRVKYKLLTADNKAGDIICVQARILIPCFKASLSIVNNDFVRTVLAHPLMK